MNVLSLPIDDRVLATTGRYSVLAECQPIQLRDNGGCIDLHVVRESGHDAMYLRAVYLGETLLVIFDLRDVSPLLDEIREHHEFDVPGIVLYTLRGAFANKAELLSAMVDRPIDALRLPTSTTTSHQNDQAVAA